MILEVHLATGWCNVYQPDILTLEAHPLKFEQVDAVEPFAFPTYFAAPHPTKPDVLCCLAKRDYDGRLELTEREKEPGYGRKERLRSTVFVGWCFSEEHFTTLLTLVGWMKPAPTT